MRVLFITPRFPYPPLKGDQTVAYNRILSLSSRHEIVLLTFYEREKDLQGLTHLYKFCKKIVAVKLTKWQSILNIGVNFYTNLPLQVLYYSGSDKFQTHLHRIIQEYQIEIVHCFLLRLAPYLNNVHVPKILELIDSMQLNLKRRIVHASFFKSIILKEELKRIQKYERNIGYFFDYLTVVAEEDRKYISSSNVTVIPNGVLLTLFKPNRVRDFHIIAFSGNMSYGPNIEAVLWFANHCFPSIKREIPNVKFVIIGKEPSHEVQKLKHINGIVVVGYVTSMAQELSMAGIAIAPMHLGSGMQNKILEAMACGLPVITTTLGLGSIKAQHNQEIFVCDEAEEFTACVVDLLKNPERIQKTGENARKYVEVWHSWETSADEIDCIYRMMSNKIVE